MIEFMCRPYRLGLAHSLHVFLFFICVCVLLYYINFHNNNNNVTTIRELRAPKLDPDHVGVAGGVAKIKLAYNLVLLTEIPVVCITCTCHVSLEVIPRQKSDLLYVYRFVQRCKSMR